MKKLIFAKRQMRTILLIIAAVFADLNLTAQDFLIEPIVVNVDTAISKDDIFSSIEIYLAEAYGDINEVIKLSDKERGLIVGKGAEENYMKGMFGEKVPGGYWNYTFKIEVRDGRYRYSIYDVYLETTEGVKTTKYYGYQKKRYEELPYKLDPIFSSIPLHSINEDW